MQETYDFIQSFDPLRKLQYVNGDPSVMHCHHYSSLFTKLAMDFENLGGPDMLRDSMEESYYLVLKKAFLIRGITGAEQKKVLAEEHFRLAGLGLLQLTLRGAGGSAKMVHSHMDEGWIKKWGKNDGPVNFIGQGYLAAAFDLMCNKKLRSFRITETQSIVAGAAHSIFDITLREEFTYGG